MVGMSAETFWGGLEGNAEFEQKLRDVMGPEMGLTSGAKAVQDALNSFKVKNVAVLTPYQPVGDEQVYRFFSESGFNVIKTPIKKPKYTIFLAVSLPYLLFDKSVIKKAIG